MSGKKRLPVILVVNDDAMTRRRMAAQISHTGILRAMEASDGSEALRLVEARAPQVVVCDINMPRMNGFQFCRIMKSPGFEKFHSIPILLTSATYPDIVARQVARDVGACAYLQQPYEEADLIRLIQYAITPRPNSEADPALLLYRGTVALMDTDRESLTELSDALRADSWRVLTASSTREGLRLLQEEGVQIVLADEQLPDGGWQGILSRVQEMHPEQVLIVMVGPGREETIAELLRAGVDDYARKALGTGDLLATCHRAYRKFTFLRIHEQFQGTIERLKEMGDYLNHLIQHSEEGIFSCDVVGRVRIWNRGAEHLYGYTAAEICGQIVDDFLDPPGFERKAPDVAHILQIQGAFSEKEIWRRRKDGTIFPVRATYSPITNSDGTMIGFSVIEHDITTARRLEEELIKSERMRAITQLAVTTNDRVNTPLGVILGYAQFLQRKIAELSPEDVGALQTIEKQVQKIKGILNQLERISEPVVKEYSIEGIEMLDLTQSK